MSLTASAELLKRNSRRERAALESKELLTEYELALMRIKKTRDMIKYPSIYDYEAWMMGPWMIATEFANKKIKALEAEAKYSLHLADIDEDEDEMELFAEEKARDASLLIEKLQAATLEKQLYQRQADKITSGGIVSSSLASLTQRYIGVDGVEQEGTGRMTRVEQSQFRRSLLKEYDARLSRPNLPDPFDRIFDSATGIWKDTHLMVAAHLVPYQLGPEMMAALFGEDVRKELLSPRNGLLIPHNVERALDHGALAIVPKLEDDVSDEAMAEWVACDQREYKWKVIDPKAEDFLELTCCPRSQGYLTVQELDGMKLCFRPTCTHRPRVEYMYFLFILSVLKMAWRNGIDNRAKSEDNATLKKLVGKKAWTTEGRYLHRAMVVALRLEEELGYAVDSRVDIPPRLRPAIKDDEAQERVDIALLALIRAFDILKTKLEEECELKLHVWGEDDEAGDDDEDKFRYWSDVEEDDVKPKELGWEEVDKDSSDDGGNWDVLEEDWMITSSEPSSSVRILD